MALTANLTSTATNLFVIVSAVKAALLKLFKAVVIEVTDSAKPKPDILDRTRADSVLFKVSSNDKP